MGILEKAVNSKRRRPYFVAIHGDPTSGKSTWGSRAPNPYFIDTDDGLDQLSVMAIKPKTFQEVMQITKEFAEGKHPYKTLVADTVGKIEKFIASDIAKENGKLSVGDIPYGRGAEYVALEFKKFVDELVNVREAGFNVILISHTVIKNVKNPLGEDYIRYQPDLSEKCAAILTQAVDALLYCTFELFTKKQEGRNKAFGDGTRISYTENRPGHLAKNRFNLPYSISTGWEDFVAAVDANENPDMDGLKSKISEILNLINEPDLSTKVIAYTKNADVIALKKTIDKLNVRMEALSV